MAAYFNQKTKKWDANFSYKDYENNSKKKMKRGFQTKEEAEAWETEYKELCKKDMSKTFGEFYKNYESDIRPRVKESTWRSKEYVIKHKILPYYQDKPMNSIKPLDILKWQNELLEMHNKKGNELSGTYLKTIQSQLSAIFNHAVRYYDLNGNPVKKAGPIGIVRANEVNYWTKEEYLRFIESMKDNNKYYYALEILYWCGLRTGEVLALTESDFDFVHHTVSITKSFQIINGAEVITKPKTINGIRTVTVPVSLCKQLKEYVGQLNDGERLFPYARQRLYKELKKGIQVSGVKDIRLHDLRHSHVSLLIHMGYTAFEIAKRVGHKSERVTYYYAHMFPGVQENMAERLDAERNSVL
ncbi:site-specific integrase [Agathobacter ruminis]|uniref:Site-specific integrase n=1 Tax=Agathobacter ruminis TaxID=1712665 RepID=A0A2G3E491_9FIRM|nr:site-specific integrase [Agathobacter ruminis]MDC7302245.1 site-specific integrase [Agathobacter ruminis]PHU37893.1 site-specific integrase [Agathobacter ruminis]